MSDDKNDKLIGQTIKSYKIVEHIGRGKSTKIYMATDERDEKRKVAIKFLIHHDASLEVFEKNMEVIRKLEHPHILPLYDYGNLEGMPYVVMFYPDSGNLAHTIEDGTATVQVMLKFLKEICEALEFAHNKQIIHRDIKPSNIFIDAGKAYLGDFGVPKYTQSHEITSMGSNIGTAAYLPPEQVMGGNVDERSDIFSLGITLFEVSAGHHPFSEERNQIKLMMKMMNEPIPPLENDKLDAELVSKLNTIIQKATAKKPDDRYASISEFAKQLEGL